MRLESPLFGRHWRRREDSHPAQLASILLGLPSLQTAQRRLDPRIFTGAIKYGHGVRGSQILLVKLADLRLFSIERRAEHFEALVEQKIAPWGDSLAIVPGVDQVDLPW